VTLQGQLSEFQSSEDSVLGGHPTTTAIQNDLAEVLLGLFIPWERLPNLVRQSPTRADNVHNILHLIWATVEPTLPLSICTFAKNIERLRKSKSDCQANAILRKQSAQHTSPLDHDLSNPPYHSSDSEDETSLISAHADEILNTETLLAAFFAVSKRWTHEAYDTQRKITTLDFNSPPPRRLQTQNLHPLDILNNNLLESSGLEFFPFATLQQWQTHLRAVTTQADQEPHTDVAASIIPDLDDFNFDMEGVLVPLLTDSDPLPDLHQRCSCVGENPTGASLTMLIVEAVPLNEKQYTIVEKILSEALSWTDHLYDSSKRDQTLLYIGGEGGVGKSQVIKAVAIGMDLIYCKNELILMAPTGAAADVIGGNTYHTSLGISLN
jgi:hypothetical protein